MLREVIQRNIFVVPRPYVPIRSWNHLCWPGNQLPLFNIPICILLNGAALCSAVSNSYFTLVFAFIPISLRFLRTVSLQKLIFSLSNLTLLGSTELSTAPDNNNRFKNLCANRDGFCGLSFLALFFGICEFLNLCIFWIIAHTISF